MRKYISISMFLFFSAIAILTPSIFATSDTLETNTDEKIYIYERNLITHETTRREVNPGEEIDIMTLANENVSMDPYIPEGKEIDNSDENGISPQTIINGDNRYAVDTNYFPYSAVGYLSIDSGNYRGTAFMVDDNIAVTAGHCVVGHDYIEFFPGRDGDNYPYGSAWVTRYIWAGPENYGDNQPFEYDWAVLVLDSDIGNNTGWFGVSNMAEYPNGPSGWVGLLADVTGYPGDKGFSQYRGSGNILDATDQLLVIDSDIKGGSSGSPVFRSPAGYYAYGIVVGENDGLQRNFACRINDFVYNTIMSAKSDY